MDHFNNLKLNIFIYFQSIQRRCSKCQKTTTTTSNPFQTLEELAAGAYTEITTTIDHINAGYDSLTEVDNLVKNLTGQCFDIMLLLPGDITSVPNPSKALVDTVSICGLVINTGVPNNTADFNKYIDALSKI